MNDSRPLALITGAGKRIGRAIALGLAQHGWNIAIHFNRSIKDATETQKLIQNTGAQATLYQADLASETALINMFTQIKETLGAPNLLINNASLFEYDNPENINLALFDQHMAINVKAPIVLSQAFYLAHKSAQTEGTIIHLLDQKLINPNPDYFSYTLSKMALSGAIPTQAQHFAPQVRVMGIAPGLTLPSGPQSAHHFHDIQKTNPLRIASTPEDIAETVLYIANVKSLTGGIIYVDAGQHLSPSPRDVMFIDTTSIS